LFSHVEIFLEFLCETGDVTPENSLERSYSILVMLFGAATFTFVISQVGNVMQDLSKSQAFHRNQMDQLIDFSTYRRLPDSLIYDIRRYFQHRRNWQHTENDKELLDSMSTDLRAKVMKHSYENSLKNSFVMRSIPVELRDQLYEEMQNMFARPGELLYSAGDSSNYMYSIRTGRVRVYDPRDGVQILGPGDVFGENELLFGKSRRGTATCLKYCDIALAPRSAIVSALNRDQHASNELRKKEAMLLWQQALRRAENEVRMYDMALKVRSCARKHVKQRRRVEAIRLASSQRHGNVAIAAESVPDNGSEPGTPAERDLLVVPDLYEGLSSDDDNASTISAQEMSHSISKGSLEFDVTDDPSVIAADAGTARSMTREALENAYVIRGKQLKRLQARAQVILKDISELQVECG
jgi:CRP-like cAMP-binding protein